MFGITEIYMKGFQVFEAETHIPIRRLTLLYGPNSAGKSAVEDAISLLSKLCSNQAFDTLSDFSGRGWMLSKHWRRLRDEVSGAAKEMTLGVKARVKGEIAREILSVLENQRVVRASSVVCLDYGSQLSELEVRFVFSRETDNDQDFVEILRSQEILVDGVVVGRVSELEKNFELNLDHPCFQSIKFRTTFAEEIEELLLRPYLKNIYNERTGVLALHPVSPYLDNDRHIHSSDLFLDVESVIAEYPDEQSEVSTAMDVLEQSPLIRFACAAFNALTDVVVMELGDLLRSARVPASRKIPSENDMTFYLNPNLKADSGCLHFHSERNPLIAENLGDPQYRDLAEAFHTHLRTSRGVSDGPDVRPEELNALLKCLMGERSYSLDCDYRFLVSPSDLQSIVSGPAEFEDRVSWLPTVVRMFLRDAEGRAFSFDDVGSGVGYVLPVLNSLLQAKPVVVIQQPELHLHPALQANLGDVLIQGTNRSTATIYASIPWLNHPGGFAERRVEDYRWLSRQVVVETHSEHLLLRILKRIRNSEKAGPGANLSIGPDDLAVLYFDPQVDGSTLVKHLRIANDGEFLDRWPRGFFAERDGELFDE